MTRTDDDSDIRRRFTDFLERHRAPPTDTRNTSAKIGAILAEFKQRLIIKEEHYKHIDVLRTDLVKRLDVFMRHVTALVQESARDDPGGIESAASCTMSDNIQTELDAFQVFIAVMQRDVGTTEYLRCNEPHCHLQDHVRTRFDQAPYMIAVACQHHYDCIRRMPSLTVVGVYTHVTEAEGRDGLFSHHVYTYFALLKNGL